MHVRQTMFTKVRPQSAEGMKSDKNLANGYFGMLFALVGDLDYFAKYLGMPRWSLSSGPCALCRCARDGANSWLDCRLQAGWIGTTWTARSWLQWPAKSQCKIFMAPGVSICTLALDWMHCKYLGSDMYLYGSILYLLVFQILKGASPLSNLNQCGVYIRKYQRDNRSPTCTAKAFTN